MRHDGGGQAMLTLRRAQRAADEATMVEAMLRRPPGDDTPVPYTRRRREIVHP